MRTLAFLMVGILSALLAIATYDILIYQQWIPKLIWSVDTLWLDYQGERGLYMACEHGRESM